MRHLIIAFRQKFDVDKRIPQELAPEEINEIVSAADAEEREMQAGHSARTGTTIYSQTIITVFQKKFERAKSQFKVSVK